MIASKKCLVLFKKFFRLLIAISFSVLLMPLCTIAQPVTEKGLPFITNYFAKDYQASPQNWSIIEDDRGIMYFGNSYGLLEYDGVKWRLISSVNSIVRSLSKDKNGHIYYGGYGNFGYLAPDSLGQTQFHSLLKFVPAAYRNFNDVWTVHVTEQGIYFQSREHIFRLRQKNSGSNENWEVKVWNSPNKFMFAFYLDDTYYVHQQGVGLLKMINDSLVIIPGSEFMAKERVQVMLPYSSPGEKSTEKGTKQYLFGAFYSGLYLYNGTSFTHFATETDSLIKNNTLYKGILLQDGSYALSTAGKGIIIVDKQGKKLQQLNREVGLQDESVYAIYTDRKGTLWMALDNGISRVESTSPFTQFTVQSGINTATISITRFKGDLYTGTTNGLLRFNSHNAKFEQVKGVPSNQVFTLIPDENSLLIATDGLYYVSDHTTGIIKKSEAGNLLISGLSNYKKNPDILLAGLAGGIAIFKKNGHNTFQEKATSSYWVYAGNIPGVTEDVWSFTEGINGTVWAGAQQGVLRLSDFMDSTGNPTPAKSHVERFGTADGLSVGSIHVSSANGKVFFISNKSVYRFDETNRRFITDTTFGEIGIGNDPNQYVMTTDYKGRIWLNFGKETALAFPQAGGGYHIDKTPFLPLGDHVVANIFPEPNGIIWFATTDGLIKYDENLKKDYDEKFKTILRNVIAGREALTLLPSGNQETSLKYKKNTLRFEYAAPFFEQEKKTQYQTWLEGFEPGWSGWDYNTYKEYTNLPGGKYNFHVRAKNIYQKVGQESVYTFTIQPPWYGTWWAYLFYILAGAGLIYLVVRYRTKQLHEKHRELEKTVSERTHELSQRVEELAVINSVQEALVSELDMRAIYNLVGDRIREVFNAQAVVIATFDHQTGTEQFQYTIENGERFYPGARSLDKLRMHLIQSRQKIVIKTTQESFAWFGMNTVAGTKPMKSGVFVPLIIGDKITSYVSLQNVDKENAFSGSDIRLLETLANSMSVALENARLFDETTRLLKETEQRNAELAIINSVQQGLASKLEMQAIIDLVGDKINEIFNTDVVSIATYDRQSNMIHYPYMIECGERQVIESRPPHGFRMHVIQTRQPLVINKDAEKATIEYGNPALAGSLARSLVFVPLIVGEKVTGIISLQNIEHENAFSNSDVSLLTTLANSMSVALESARLFDETNRLLKETEQRTSELAVINSVQEGLVAQMDMQSIYDLVGEKIRNIFQAHIVDIVTYDKNENIIEDRYAYEKGDRTLLGPRKPHGFRQHVIQTKQVFLVNKDLDKVSREFDSYVLIGEEPKSAVFVPMIAGGELTGIISLQNLDHENAFSESAVNLLTTLANSMSVALGSAGLFDETKRLLKETEQRTAELSVINSVQEGLAREMDIQGIYELVGEKIREIFNAQVIDIVTYDKITDLIEDRYTYEKGDRSLLGPRPLKGFRKHVIETTKSLVINKDVVLQRPKYDQTVIVGEGAKSLVLVPMIAGGEVTGVISLQNLDQENAFSDSDVNLLTTLANSMSVALENARLFDETNRLLKETEQRTAELAVINSVQEGLARELDMQGIYNLVGDRIRDLFDAQSVIIATFDHEAGVEHFQYGIEKGIRSIPAPRPLDKLRQHLIQTRQKILINKSTEEIRNKFGLKVIPGTEWPKSLLFVPLISGDKVKSYVSLQNIDRENAFSDADVRLLETLANSMSVALENARLFDETNRLLKETEQRTAELAVINSVQEGLAHELDMQGIYNLVGNRIRDLFNAQVVIIATFDHEKKLEYFNYHIEKGEISHPVPRPFDKVRQHLIQTGQNILINENVSKAAAEFGMRVVPGTEMPKSLLFMPMKVGDKVTSYVSLQNIDEEHAFSFSDVRLLGTLANSMSVALENARLFDETNRLLKETEQRTAELAVINSVQEGLAKELDMRAIYELVGERIRNVFDAQAVIIATFDHETGTEHFQYVIEKGIRSVPHPRRFDKLRQHLIQTRQKILINKNTEEIRTKFGLKVIAGTEMPKSLIFVPLISGDKVKSYVSLQNVDKENAFSDANVRLLETVANSMSVALENARLFDETNRLLKETEQRTAELAVINSVQEGLVREMDMQGIFDLVGDRVQKLFNAQVVIIASFDLAKKTEQFNYAFENGEKFEFKPRPVSGMRQILIDKKHTIYIETEEKARTEYGITAIGDTKMPKSLLFVPLLSGNEIRGYVSLQNIDIEYAFSESDIRLLETLGNSMTVALENARLFDETNRLLKETEQRTAELAIINSVQEGLASKLDIQSIYDLVGDKIRDVFDTQGISISFYNRQKNFITHPYYLFKGKRINELGFELGKGLTSHIIQTAQPLLINEKAAERFKELGAVYAAAETEDTTKSWLGVPLISGGQVNGTIRLENYEREFAYSESDVSLLQTLANSMSVALENARLFDETNRLLKETEQRKAELAVINNVQEGLVKEFKSKAIYELVGERLCELFDTQTVLIRTFDHESGTENWRYAIEKGVRQYSEPRPLIWANKKLIQTRKPLLINENYVETAKKYGGSGVSMGKPPKSAVFVPMIVGDIVRGSVSLQNVDKEHAFNESDLGLLATLTNSMGVALENARLFDETALLLAEAKQRASELSTVNSISKALASQLDPDDLIKLVGDQIKNLFTANIVYLALLNQKTKIIQFPYQYGDDLAPMKLGEGLTSKIILTKEPLLINKDVQELTAQLGVQRVGIPASSYLGVPIPVGDEIIGVLSVQSTEHENRFNENDQRLLSTIASSVGVALRNATLFEDVQQAKMEAETARKTAEKANESKSAFLSTVSHELRTPLTSVLGFTKIIRKRLEEKIFPLTDKTDLKTGKTIQQISENLSVVISEGERLTTLINDVLDLAKIEAGKMEWNLENVSMIEIAERAISATTGLFEQKDLKLVKQIEDNLPNISGDKDKLIQVIINLFSNAVKFTNKGSVTCKVYKHKDELVVSISDTGIGIAREDFNAVFEQFKQVGGDTLTDKPKGTGLGLPICKEIIEHHGGRIWLESKVNKGSIFSFALPVIKSEAIKKPLHLDVLVRQLKEQMEQSKIIMGKNASILVVDDDNSIRSLLHQELSDAGYFIDEATNGKEALESVRKNRPDLIILDIMMPEMNGFDVAAILKNDPQTMDIPIIVLSIVQDKARGYRIGVDRYLTKPIDTSKLFAEVGALLEQGKSKKKVMVVDEDSTAVNALTEVLQQKGYHVVESDGKELVEKAILTKPDIIILNSMISDKQEIVQSLRFEKGLENVLFLIYQ